MPVPAPIKVYVNDDGETMIVVDQDEAMTPTEALEFADQVRRIALEVADSTRPA